LLDLRFRGFPKTDFFTPSSLSHASRVFPAGSAPEMVQYPVHVLDMLCCLGRIFLALPLFLFLFFFSIHWLWP